MFCVAHILQVPERGRGIVASRDIRSGELIIAETPLVCWCVTHPVHRLRCTFWHPEMLLFCLPTARWLHPARNSEVLLNAQTAFVVLCLQSFRTSSSAPLGRRLYQLLVGVLAGQSSAQLLAFMWRIESFCVVAAQMWHQRPGQRPMRITHKRKRGYCGS